MDSESGNEEILVAEGLGKDFLSGGHVLTVLEDAHLRVRRRESVAIVGPSGSGKTTFLALCAGLDTPTRGTVTLAGQPMSRMGEDARAALRNREVGFVFQSFQLFPTLTALENVMAPLELRGSKGVARVAHDWLGRVGLTERAGHYPSQLSGGEQQRVALARAFVNEPALLFADEPTGNLDERTGAHIEELLLELNREAGTTLIIVTHDRELAALAGRRVTIEAGRVREEPAIQPRGQPYGNAS